MSDCLERDPDARATDRRLRQQLVCRVGVHLLQHCRQVVDQDDLRGCRARDVDRADDRRDRGDRAVDVCLRVVHEETCHEGGRVISRPLRRLVLVRTSHRSNSRRRRRTRTCRRRR